MISSYIMYALVNIRCLILKYFQIVYNSTSTHTPDIFVLWFLAARRGGLTVLTTIQQRKTWEAQFDNNYIKPTFNTNRVGLCSVKHCYSNNAYQDCLALISWCIRSLPKYFNWSAISYSWPLIQGFASLKSCLSLPQDQRIRSIKQQLVTADSVDLKRILSTADKPFNEENMLASPGLWEYKQNLTLPRVENILANNEQRQVCSYEFYFVSMLTCICIRGS